MTTANTPLAPCEPVEVFTCNDCAHICGEECGLHGREAGIDLDLCDVCYWRKRAEERDAEIAAYKDAIASHNSLVRELDVIWNGEAGVAKQASLCDMVSQIGHDLVELRKNELRLAWVLKKVGVDSKFIDAAIAQQGEK